MSMETLNVIQFAQIFAGYLGYTVALPALVFYKKAKRFHAAVRFLIYFTIGNFYVINLVQVLELIHISYRITLFLFTFVPAFLLSVKFYHIPVIPYVKKILSECKHYILRELGFKSFVRHRLQECKVVIKKILRNLWRLFKENAFDIPFLLLFFIFVWKICGPELINDWGYGASDIPVHNYWINGLVNNNIYIEGIYPMGMHCMIYYLATMLSIPIYVVLRLFWLTQYIIITIMILLFLKGHCRTRFLPYLGIIFFIGAKYFVSISYARYSSTLPQIFGMLFILPSIYFAMEFFRARKHELETGVNKIRCESSWHMLGFAMNFSMTLASHFYDTMIAGILCIGIVVGYGYWFWRKEYFFRVMLGGILSILMAFLPMAAAFLTGKGLQGSMYWAMSIIGLRDYTELIFRIICLIVIGVTVGGILFIFREIRKGKISLGNQPVPKSYILTKIFFQIVSLASIAAIVWIGWKYRSIILWGVSLYAFKVSDMTWLIVFIGGALFVGFLQRYVIESTRGAEIFSIVVAEIILGIILISEDMDWLVLMQADRIGIYFAYLIPVLLILILDGLVNILLFARFPRIQQTLGLIIAVAVIFSSQEYEWIREYSSHDGLEMNEAILCTTNILNDNKENNYKWTIVSANDEYRMIEEYGRHTETIEFLYAMEFWNPTKEILIPTEKVYFYIEKKPLNYANGYEGEIPVISEEQAKKILPQNSGLNAYSGPNRSITMSRMYYWAQKFMELYPNEMKVYYENERFVCYYIEQNEYRLYNFAIDYDYN